MPSSKRKIGDIGEKIALRYLKKNNYKIIDKNYQRKWGELDIIAQNKKIPDQPIVFVEVKTALKKENGFPPEMNVSFAKQQKLIRTAETFLIEKNYPENIFWQIDVIAVEIESDYKNHEIRHFESAVGQ